MASYGVHRSTGARPVPVAVFAATGGDPEIHVDARYLAYAQDRFPHCSFGRLRQDAGVVVRDRAQVIVGIIPARMPPGPPRPRSTA